jgi:hypothetical protein
MTWQKPTGAERLLAAAHDNSLSEWCFFTEIYLKSLLLHFQIYLVKFESRKQRENLGAVFEGG